MNKNKIIVHFTSIKHAVQKKISIYILKKILIEVP